MKGRQPGRPTKWVSASVEQWLDINRRGFDFVIWEKWTHSPKKKLGTLTVSVGGLRWRAREESDHGAGLPRFTASGSSPANPSRPAPACRSRACHVAA